MCTVVPYQEAIMAKRMDKRKAYLLEVVAVQSLHEAYDVLNASRESSETDGFPLRIGKALDARLMFGQAAEALLAAREA